MQFLRLLLGGVRLSLLRSVLIHGLVPLVMVEVVAHLPDGLGSRRLVLYGDSSQPSGHVELNMVALQDVLVLLVDLHHFVALYALVVLALDWARGRHLFHLLLEQLVALAGVELGHLLLFRLGFPLGGGGRGRLDAYLDVVGGKEAEQVGPADGVSHPPAIFIGLLD